MNPPAHTLVSPSPCKYCSEARGEIGTDRRPLGWGTSGGAASSGCFFHLPGKGEFRGLAAQPQRLCQHCLQQGTGSGPRLALPFVHLLSSGLTASIALGRELLATRADGSNPLALGFAQKANLTGFKASTSANYLTRAFPDVLSEKCQCKGSGGLFSHMWRCPASALDSGTAHLPPSFSPPAPLAQPQLLFATPQSLFCHPAATAQVPLPHSS